LTTDPRRGDLSGLRGDARQDLQGRARARQARAGAAAPGPRGAQVRGPYPKQDDDALKQLKQLDDAEIQQHGWGSPPYHPMCRGQLVPLGTVEQMVPVEELVVEQEVGPAKI
jgi:hypothetical protein